MPLDPITRNQAKNLQQIFNILVQDRVSEELNLEAQESAKKAKNARQGSALCGFGLGPTRPRGRKGESCPHGIPLPVGNPISPLFRKLEDS